MTINTIYRKKIQKLEDSSQSEEIPFPTAHAFSENSLSLVKFEHSVHSLSPFQQHFILLGIIVTRLDQGIPKWTA